eukprot:3245822-Prymnesium_polylepis.2
MVHGEEMVKRWSGELVKKESAYTLQRFQIAFELQGLWRSPIVCCESSATVRAPTSAAPVAIFTAALGGGSPLQWAAKGPASHSGAKPVPPVGFRFSVGHALLSLCGVNPAATSMMCPTGSSVVHLDLVGEASWEGKSLVARINYSLTGEYQPTMSESASVIIACCAD